MANPNDAVNYFLKGEFYKSVAVQVKSGNRYNIAKTDSLLDLFLERGLLRDAARAHLHLARIYAYYGDVQKEVAEYVKAIDLYKQLDHPPGIAAVHSDLALMYYDQHDYAPAFKNARKAVALDQPYHDPVALHRDYNNLAIIYEHTGPIGSAIYYHKIAVDYAYQSKDPHDIGLSLSNLGNNYSMAGAYQLAADTLLKALKIRSAIGSKRGLAYTNNRLAYLYTQTRDLKKARFYAEQSLDYAEQLSELKIKRMAYNTLMNIAELENKPDEVYRYAKLVRVLEDSLHNSSNTKEITKTIMRYEFQQQELADSLANYAKEIKLKAEYDTQILKEKYIRNVLFAVGLSLLILAIGLYYRFRFIKKSRYELQLEKNRSDDLLLNILPYEVAEELKLKGKSEARDFEKVTVLFSDFKGFTQASEKLTAKELVKELNACFKAFDEIIEKFRLEKIKTIGDAYMAAGGLNASNNSQPQDVVRAGLAMQEFMRNHAKELEEKGLPYFKMRVGIHTGPVVAGIVGVKKFQYHIWGDTVNTASRMESSGDVGKVNVSQATYELLKPNPQFAFESRGKIKAKGKGEMEMWFVSSKK